MPSDDRRHGRGRSRVPVSRAPESSLPPPPGEGPPRLNGSYPCCEPLSITVSHSWPRVRHIPFGRTVFQKNEVVLPNRQGPATVEEYSGDGHRPVPGDGSP